MNEAVTRRHYTEQGSRREMSILDILEEYRARIASQGYNPAQLGTYVISGSHAGNVDLALVRHSLVMGSSLGIQLMGAELGRQTTLRVHGNAIDFFVFGDICQHLKRYDIGCSYPFELRI